MRNTVGAFLILVSSVAVAGGSHNGGGGGHAAAASSSGGRGMVAVGSSTRVSAAAGSRSPLVTASRISPVQRLASAATRPPPLRPKPKPAPRPTLHAAHYFPQPATVHPAGWYPVACTEEELRQHRCPEEAPTIRLRQ